LIKKCINNVLENAIRFSPQNVTIEFNIYFENQNIMCEISDNGKGFDPDSIDQSFDLFATGDVCSDSVKLSFQNNLMQ
jgi:K+-sensing histidine kinase KdpD